MIEPSIQYATTADGVSIAFWTLGEGEPLVYMPSIPWSNAQQEWQIPDIHRMFRSLAQKRVLVRYDSRGSGLSDRQVTDYSLDAHLLDLEAVTEHLGLGTFALLGILNSGPVAIAYAARHPERVSHLVLWCTYACGADYYRSPQLQATRALMDKDWEVYTETLAHVTWGWSAGEEARRFAAFIRRTVTPEVVQAMRAAIDQFDVRDLLPGVRAPTLVLHRRQFSLPALDAGRHLAAQIPNARLVVLEGASPAPFLGDSKAVLRAIGDFLEVELELASGPAGGYGRPPVTILFTDMEGSTTITQRLGDANAQEIMHSHNTIVRDALAAHGGSEIKHTGDGIMASFRSASRALGCAIAVQRAFAQHNQSNPDTPIRVRIGLNAGEPVAEADAGGRTDLFGTAVQLAARICANTEPGQIVASDVVRGLVAGKDIMFADLGEVALRGFEDPVRLYQVRWREDE